MPRLRRVVDGGGVGQFRRICCVASVRDVSVVHKVCCNETKTWSSPTGSSLFALLLNNRQVLAQWLLHVQQLHVSAFFVENIRPSALIFHI